MKIYELPQRQDNIFIECIVSVGNKEPKRMELKFDHMDGMYGLLYTPENEIVNINGGTEIEQVYAVKTLGGKQVYKLK